MKLIKKTIIEDKQNYWDITIPKNHNFVLENGLVVHNCGTGLGFSVERQYINQLPEISEEFHNTDTTIIVADSKIGWASSFRQLISLLYQGMVPKWDTSKVRPSGAKLKTFGGRASGPEPLEDLFRFTISMFRNAAGRKLNSLECHDLMCKVADIVVVGGVRRSALISLSNLTDQRMRNAKQGQWWVAESQRALANNSVCYTEKPDIGIFMDEWKSLYASKCGERGIFNRDAAIRNQPERRRELGYTDYGCNPCSEIVLRSKSFCNLTEVVIRPEDTLDTLKEKIRLATILGTLQSTLTKFRYLSSIWKKNCEDERLLGVSLTGIMDHSTMNGSEGEEVLKQWLNELKLHAIEVNVEWAAKLGINPATAITCVKPSGCFEKNQKIKTDKGDMSFDEIFKMNGINLNEKITDYRQWYDVTEEIKVFDENNEEQVITKLFVNGVEDTLKFTMDDGYVIECTLNHKFKLTTGEWKMARELTENDEIMEF